jgi:hypothetical protein
MRLIVLLLAAAPALAQTGEFTVDTRPASSQILDLLSSQDPRLIAWGAYFAGQHRDSDALNLLLTQLDHWQPVASASEAAENSAESTQSQSGNSGQKSAQKSAQSDALAEILDALIQNNVALNLPQLTVIRDTFPDQALILAARTPQPQASRFLLTMYSQRHQPEHVVSARVAAMMLAKAPPPGFAASILAETREQLNIKVVKQPSEFDGILLMCGGSCGEGVGPHSRAGWPPLFTYRLTQNRREDHDQVLVEAGSDAIFIHRLRDTQIWGSCSSPRALDDYARQNILAEMLGVSPDGLEWSAIRNKSIAWESGDQFQRDLSTLVNAQAAKLRALTDTFYSRNLIAGDEVQSAQPQLLVGVSDNRGRNASTALPQWSSPDPRVTVSYSDR